MASEKKSDYTHYVEDHKGGVDFLNTTNRYLVTSIQQLKDIFEENKDKKYMSLDLETNDLDPSKETSFIVGYSFSFNGKDGYYVPVKHENPPYLGNESLDLLYQVCLNLDRVFLFNVMFDFNWLEFAGYDMSVVPYYDLMVGFFLADTNVPFPSLKQCEVKYLGWNMKRSFEEALGDNWNFYYTDAQTVVDYPALDAISTYQLAPISLKYYKESKLSGKIDNEVLYPLMRFMREGIRHDVPYIKHVMEEQDQRLKELEKEIYELVGYEFKISSPKQLSDALLACGIDTGVRTKTGYMKGGIDELEAVYKTNPNPVLKVLVEYKSLVKAHGSYSKPLYEYTSATPDSRLRYCYHAFRAPTGRLACGKDGKNTYYAKINEQSIPKPKYKQWYVHPYKEGDKVYPSDRVVLDWRFSLEEESDYYVEGLDPHWNLRNTFLPEENSYWVSIDYSTQELKLMANYSDCKLWKDAFINNADLHKNMAINMFGEENYSKDKRSLAKGCSFGLIYGMSPYTMVHNFGISLEEAEDLYNKFWSAVPEIANYQKRCIAEARRTGTIYNYFGRPRRVKSYFSSPDRKKQSFGERTVRNTIIQSSGADITKTALIKIWRQLCSNPKYKDSIRFLSTIHDEINVSINYKDRELFDEILHKFYDIMYAKVKGWDVPFDVGLEIGIAWGDSFPFEYDQETRQYKPDMHKVEKKAKPKEEPKPQTQVIDDILDFNMDLD